ncbi:MAG TPA: hypothetical protein VFA50_05215 [Stellaceae bacterium]|nr:hypothetical protein [Stellaceae bacterium]
MAALGLLVAAGAWRLASHACPGCGARRSWSKGVPPWRCRRCGGLYSPAPPRRRKRDGGPM